MRYTTFGRQTGLRVSELGPGHRARSAPAGATAPSRPRRAACSTATSRRAATSSTAPTPIRTARPRPCSASSSPPSATGWWSPASTRWASNDKVGIAATGNSRKAMMASVEGSLKRLKTDYLDLYWVHMADGLTPVEEIVRGFDDLVSAGKILYAGLSDFPAWRAARAPRWPSCAAGRRSPACRSNTAWSSARPTASCCRWPRAWAWAWRSGRPWAAAS